MLFLEPPDLGDGFGQANGHRRVIGVDEDVPLRDLCAQTRLPQAPESQFTDGIPQGTAYHATPEFGFQIYDQIVSHQIPVHSGKMTRPSLATLSASTCAKLDHVYLIERPNLVQRRKVICVVSGTALLRCLGTILEGAGARA